MTFRFVLLIFFYYFDTELFLHSFFFFLLCALDKMKLLSTFIAMEKFFERMAEKERKKKIAPEKIYWRRGRSLFD